MGQLCLLSICIISYTCWEALCVLSVWHFGWVSDGPLLCCWAVCILGFLSLHTVKCIAETSGILGLEVKFRIPWFCSVYPDSIPLYLGRLAPFLNCCWPAWRQQWSTPWFWPLWVYAEAVWTLFELRVLGGFGLQSTRSFCGYPAAVAEERGYRATATVLFLEQLLLVLCHFWAQETSTDWWDRIVLKIWDDQQWQQNFRREKAIFSEICAELATVAPYQHVKSHNPLRNGFPSPSGSWPPQLLLVHSQPIWCGAIACWRHCHAGVCWHAEGTVAPGYISW